MAKIDKKDFDYTSKMIAQQRGFSYTTEWPGGFNEKLCTDCVHWTATYKTHGVRGCEIRDTHYCLAHDKCYWKRKNKNEFLTEEDFEL